MDLMDRLIHTDQTATKSQFQAVTVNPFFLFLIFLIYQSACDIILCIILFKAYTDFSDNKMLIETLNFLSLKPARSPSILHPGGGDPGVRMHITTKPVNLPLNG